MTTFQIWVIFKRMYSKILEYIFNFTLLRSSKHPCGAEDSRKSSNRTRATLKGLHKCWEFANPSWCSNEVCYHGKISRLFICNEISRQRAQNLSELCIWLGLRHSNIRCLIARSKFITHNALPKRDQLNDYWDIFLWFEIKQLSFRHLWLSCFFKWSQILFICDQSNHFAFCIRRLSFFNYHG